MRSIAALQSGRADPTGGELISRVDCRRSGSRDPAADRPWIRCQPTGAAAHRRAPPPRAPPAPSPRASSSPGARPGSRRRPAIPRARTAQGFGELARAVDAARDFERDDRAEAALLPLRDLVPGMRGQARVVDASSRLLLRKNSAMRLRIAAVFAQPHMQRAQAAQREIAVERRAREAEAIAPPAELLGELRRLRR